MNKPKAIQVKCLIFVGARKLIADDEMINS